MQVRTLLKKCYQFLEINNTVIDDKNEWMTLPISFFDEGKVKGICIELDNYEFQTLSKYVCFVFDDKNKVYYSADYIEGDESFEIRYRCIDGVCKNASEVIPDKYSIKEFFEAVSQHFKENYGFNQKA